jgi:predicted acetyltransferase
MTEADLDEVLDIRVRAFGSMSSHGVEQWRQVNQELVAQERVFGVFVDGRLAASGKARGFEQAWHGRLVPMAGMAGITVLPEFRGRGVGTSLMRGLVEVALARGEPVSALFPAAVPVYRHLGWELVGAQSRFALSASHLRTLGGEASPVRATASDVDELVEVCRAALVSARVSGPLLWSAQEWHRRLLDPATFVYRTDDGFVVYGWEGSDLAVDFIWGATEDTLRSLWSLVGSGSSVAKTVRAFLSPEDPVFWLLPEEAGHEVTRHGWMLRVLDVPAALAARGYPPGQVTTVALRVDDRQSGTNSGTWRLEVSNGEGRAERIDEAQAVTFTERGLAGLYAGRSLSDLRRAGLATGGDAQADEQLASVFATSPAHLIDYF